MVQFKHNERLFLESYCNFTVNIRSYIIDRLCDDYQKTTTQDEKDCLHILALEQWFMFYETLEGFIRAIKNRKRKSIFDSLSEDFNIQNLYTSWKGKSDNQILKELEVSINDFSEEKQKIIRKSIIGIAGLWKDKKLYNLMRAVIPVFYKLKHKLLVYQEDGELVIALNEKEQQLFKKILKDSKTTQGKLGELSDISAYKEMAEYFKTAIKELIAIRLLELK